MDQYMGTYTIKTNEDWMNLDSNEPLVDISNNAYFGFRAMEKGVRAILYDPSIIDSLIRIGKESRKFIETKHVLMLSEDTLGYESIDNDEAFLMFATRLIEQLFELNPLLHIEFFIKTGSNERKNKLISVLNDIYCR